MFSIDKTVQHVFLGSITKLSFLVPGYLVALSLLLQRHKILLL